ncbi:MAG: hypothetical protein GX872_02920 [Firmicutes bacterium]|nr:hypothetical protein [Bacillota bacterium]HXL04493.1 hypothetical protein [Bacillota bacterium]
MLRRFFLKALAALVIYCCVMGIFRFSPWLTGKIKPYLSAQLTESIDFTKVKAVMVDLFSSSSTQLPGYVEPRDAED